MVGPRTLRLLEVASPALGDPGRPSLGPDAEASGLTGLLEERTVGDGRVLKRTVRRARARIPFYDARLGARISVVAEARDGRVRGAATLRVKSKRARRAVIRI